MALITWLIVWALFLPIVNPQSFRTNCTLPHEEVNFVSSSNVRSTLDILWGSLSTIFLCTYTVLHLNIPQRYEATDSWLLVITRWLSGKPKWMLLTVLLPELLVGKALGDFIAAWRSSKCELMKRKAREAGITWTMTHAFYANMGGFILRDPNDQCRECSNVMKNHCRPVLDPLEPNVDNYSSISDGPTLHGHNNMEELEMHDEIERKFFSYQDQHAAWQRNNDSLLHMHRLDVGDVSCESESWDLPIAVSSASLCVLLSAGVIKQLPSISEDYIKRLGKEDVFIKLLTLLQVLWLSVQLLVRKVHGLPSTQLEVVALGFAICAFTSYLLWLPKPKDVTLATEVVAVRNLDEFEKTKIRVLDTHSFLDMVLSMNEGEPHSTHVPNDILNIEATLGLFNAFNFAAEEAGFVLGVVIFGLAHLIAWDFEFPTELEQTLWRVSSLMTIGIIPCWYLVYCLCSAVWFEPDTLTEGAPGVIMSSLGILVYLSYALCRIYIMAEVFRSLFHLPPDAFKATWTAGVPHFG